MEVGIGEEVAPRSGVFVVEAAGDLDGVEHGRGRKQEGEVVDVECRGVGVV